MALTAVMELTKNMMELYTVMSDVVAERSLGFFRDRNFGSGLRSREESNTAFVHELSQTTAAIALTILKSAVRVGLRINFTKSFRAPLCPKL